MSSEKASISESYLANGEIDDVEFEIPAIEETPTLESILSSSADNTSVAFSDDELLDHAHLYTVRRFGEHNLLIPISPNI